MQKTVLLVLSSFFFLVFLAETSSADASAFYSLSSATSPSVVRPGGDITVSISANVTGADPAKVEFKLAGGGDHPSTSVVKSAIRFSSTSSNGISTYNGILAASNTEIGVHELRLRGFIGDTPIRGLDATVITEVTCSNGIFCDGTEQFVQGRCVSGSPPCDDGEECTQDICDEESQTCDFIPRGAGCKECINACGRDDGAGLCEEGSTCIDGVCTPVVHAGTCADPLPLLPAGFPLPAAGVVHVIHGDTSSAGAGVETPACGSAESGAKEIVYALNVPAGAPPVGFEARASGVGFDTVLDLRYGGCSDRDASVACNDDNLPPGNYGSRVAHLLTEGTYYLIVDGYRTSDVGPFTLEIQFTGSSCVPTCQGGNECGANGCGGSCGKCTSPNKECEPDTGLCIDNGGPAPCEPQCQGRKCGEDGCGGACGACEIGSTCIAGNCIPVSVLACNHLNPRCGEGCGVNMYCGSDCQCHAVDEPLPDLVVSPAVIENSIRFESKTFSERSCAFVEKCVGGTGLRKLLRFSVSVKNQGRADLASPPPETRPDLFTYSPCHRHYHFNDFASYELLDPVSGATVLLGRKQAFCMEDSQKFLDGPDIECLPVFTCEHQGISRGWADTYPWVLECQWLDITDVLPGKYLLKVTTNPGRTFQEASFENNYAIVPVEIPKEV